MSKKHKQKKKFRRLIQERLRQAQHQSITNQNNTKKISDEKVVEPVPAQDKSQKEDINESPENKPNKKREGENILDLKRIGIVTLLLLVILVAIYLVNLKTNFLNSLSNSLFNLFQKS